MAARIIFLTARYVQLAGTRQFIYTLVYRRRTNNFGAVNQVVHFFAASTNDVSCFPCAMSESVTSASVVTRAFR